MQGEDTSDKRQAYAGADVCKARLDLCVLGAGRRESFSVENTRAGLGRAIGRFRDLGVRRVAMEATGRLHLAAWRAFYAAGIEVLVLNPQRARAFAQAQGRLAKTDAIDARVLAQAAAALALRPRPAPTSLPLKIKEPQSARRAFIEQRAVPRGQLSGEMSALIRRCVKAQERLLSRHIDTIEDALVELIEQTPELSRRNDILRSIPGVGPGCALAMIADLTELGDADEKEIAALVGVAPMNWDSGPRRGQRRVKGGRRALRMTLFMGAIAASRHNPDLEAFRDRLVAAGKPKMLVATAVLRKLVILANALVRDDRLWEPRNA
jgi:transposase